jgi:hypothetical protein
MSVFLPKVPFEYQWFPRGNPTSRNGSFHRILVNLFCVSGEIASPSEGLAAFRAVKRRCGRSGVLGRVHLDQQRLQIWLESNIGMVNIELKKFLLSIHYKSIRVSH